MLWNEHNHTAVASNVSLYISMFSCAHLENYQISMVWFHQQDALHQSRRQGRLGCDRQCVSKKESGLTSFNFWLLEFKDNHLGWKRSQEGHKNGEAILQEQNKQAVIYDEIGTNTNGFKKAIIKFRQEFKTFPEELSSSFHSKREKQQQKYQLLLKVTSMSLWKDCMLRGGDVCSRNRVVFDLLWPWGATRYL